MWNFVNLKVSNLYTHLDTEYNFIGGELTQVVGENLDEFKSNGAGKSSLFDGLSLALIGETCKKIGKEDFINNDKEECRVELKMENEYLKSSLQIKRIFNRKRSVQVELLKNGKQDKNLTNFKNDPTKIILEEIGIEKDDLLNFFLLGQDNKNSFLVANDTKQKEIISRFANFAPLDEIEMDLKKELLEIEEDLRIKKVELETKTEKLKTLKELREQEESNFKDWKEKKIEVLRDAKNYDEKSLEELRNKIRKKNDEIEETEKSLKELKKYSSEKRIEEKKESLENLFSIRKENFEITSELLKEKGKLEVLVGKKVKCPKCNTEFIPASKLSIKEVGENMEKVKKELLKNRDVEKLLLSEIEVLQDKIEKHKRKFNEFKRKHLDLTNLLIGKEELEETIKNYLEKIKAKEVEIREVREKVFIPGKTALKELKIKLSSLKKEVEEAGVAIEEKSFLVYHAGKKGFKTYLANQAILHIEKMTNFYLQKFSDLRIKIDGYKVLKSGEIREKIEVSVLRNGIEKENFYKFSGGERSVINICCLLALHKLINNSLESGGLNFLGLDEYIISMDEENESRAIDILSKTKITTMLIMQHTISYGKNILTIRKKNGVSKII